MRKLDQRIKDIRIAMNLNTLIQEQVLEPTEILILWAKCVPGVYMRTRIGKAAFILILAFLSGYGREESRIIREEASAEIKSGEEAFIEAERKSGDEVSAETEDKEDIPEETDTQYPLMATPSTVERIDLALVSDGTYCIFDGKKYGFITEAGEEIAPCIYDIAEPFSEGMACVLKEGKYGYIDLEGETVIPFDYDRATSFVEGLAYFAVGDTYGFMDKTGTPVFYLECDSVSSFQEGLAYFSLAGRYGYIDQSGQTAIEPGFDDAGYFKEGLAKVMKEGRIGVINREGTYIVPAEYDSVSIEDQFIIAQSDGKYVCFNRTGKVILEQSDYIERITTKGDYICFQNEGKQGLIDGEGNILIEPLYDWILSLIPGQDLLIVREDELYGVVDLQGEIRIPVEYDYICYDAYLGSTERGMLVLTDADGNMQSTDAVDLSEKISCNYDSIDWLDEDRAVVGLNGLSGMIDGEGNLIEPVGYDAIRVFDNGAVWMQKDSETWFYNSRGEMIEIKGDIDDISRKGDFYQIKKSGKYGFINEQGEEVVSPVYGFVTNYEVYGSSDIYILTDYNNDIWNSVIKTGEPERVYIFEALLHNEITPRSGLYHEFTKSGSISVEDSTTEGYSAGQEDLRDCKKTYKLYDLNHTGEPILYFMAEPYVRNNFPMSYSGFYAIRDNQIAELFTGYECGGSMRGDYACLWYDRETSRVFPGTNGFWGGFGGYASSGNVYDVKGGEMTCIASFDWITQPILNYSDEELLEHAELFYDGEDNPYTKVTIAQAEEGTAQKYSVNEVQSTREEYQEMSDRYQILFYVE